MLRRGGLMMCGRGMLCPWGPKVDEWEPKGRAPGCRSRWQRRGAGRSQRAKRGHSPYSRPRALSLRPVNLMGNRAPGMRAPRNTNQFLMGEKYQLLKLRSDSVGTECSAGSDCEMDPLDMDSYLGVLENAHGALLEPQDPAEELTYCCSSDFSPLCPSPKAYWSPFTSESGGQTSDEIPSLSRLCGPARRTLAVVLSEKMMAAESGLQWSTPCVTLSSRTTCAQPPTEWMESARLSCDTAESRCRAVPRVALLTKVQPSPQSRQLITVQQYNSEEMTPMEDEYGCAHFWNLLSAICHLSSRDDISH
uniref:Uncharacterized protein n=1 Tax=Leptobrachium leishanense TaxID=445787 RepID=A0A8C5PJM8_9ANUR